MTVSSPPPASVTPRCGSTFDAKARYRDAILFFRMGDFFEMFYEDALTAARALELTLTSRSKDAAGNAVPMCGVPFHAADGYITRLVKRGFRVAICDQIEDPKQAKGVVKREVTRVVSPGTLTDASYLDAREPAFLLALAPGRAGDRLGVALLDASTGEFLAAEYAGADGRQALNEELGVLRPREVIVRAGRRGGDAAARDRAPRHRRHAARRVGVRRRSRHARRCAISCAPAACTPSGSTAIPPRRAPPARWSSTCATRRRSTSRTSAPSAGASGRTAC